jgi:integrase
MTPKDSIFERIDCYKDHEHITTGKQKCPTTWWARVRYVDPETGKPKDLQRRAESKAAAKDICNKLVADIKKTAGRIVGNERKTVADLCDHYEKTYVKEAKYIGDTDESKKKISGMRSWYTVKKQVEMIRNYFGQTRLTSLDDERIRKFKEDRFETPTNAGGQRSIATVNRELALLRRMLNVAIGKGWLTGNNPFKHEGDKLITNAFEEKRERIITQAEENALLAACNAPKRGHLRAIIIAALDTGCRRGELLKLRWQDVDFETGLIQIIAFNSKTAKPRIVEMTARLRVELERLKAESRADDPKFRVFGGLESVKKSFVGARRDAGLPDLRFHDLRHTAATRLVQHIPLPEVGRILGHQQPGTTYRYVNANKDTARRAAAALDAFNSPVLPDAIAETPASEMVN